MPRSSRPAPAPSGVKASKSAAVERAKRILGGAVRPDDYLSVAEVEDEVRVVADRLKEEAGLDEVPAEALTQLRHEFALQYHCGGKEALCRRSAEGVVVLAVGAANVEEMRRLIPTENRPGFVIEYPHPWRRG